MNEDSLAFLKSQRVSVVGILQEDATIHSATLHFAFAETDTFYFLTHTSSKKCQSLLGGKEMKASVVIGFDEDNCQTFQAEGRMKIATGDDATTGWEVYGSKYPERKKAQSSDESALLQFTSTWTRFSGLDTKKNFSS